MENNDWKSHQAKNNSVKRILLSPLSLPLPSPALHLIHKKIRARKANKCHPEEAKINWAN